MPTSTAPALLSTRAELDLTSPLTVPQPTVCTVCNGSGSAGKTTTVDALATMYAERGLRVGVVDLDPQGNVTFAAGIEAVEGHTVSDALLRRAEPAICMVPHATVPNVWVMPTDRELATAAVELERSPGGVMRLRKVVQTIIEALGLDIVFIDCPGAIGFLTITALVASQKAVTVTVPALKELQGLAAIEELIEQVGEAYHDSELALDAIVPCNMRQITVHREGLALLQDTYGDLVTSPIRMAATVPEAYAQQKPLTVYAPKADVTTDYRIAGTEVFEKVFAA